MFFYKPIKAQLIDERKKSLALKAQAEKLSADLEYVAMMADVELDDETEDETDGDE